MEKPEFEPQILANRQGVSFWLVRGNTTVECIVTIAALEPHFWLEPRARDARIERIFRDGYSRIRAIAERKLLAHPCARLELTPDDFERPRTARVNRARFSKRNAALSLALLS
ncbi:hypothetical protein LMG28727_07000 [Paraburkholderia kirstenboschensis]|nr:hypothetical protein LMG28727_07000 [Paraburkholderia kirstenboschensis]